MALSALKKVARTVQLQFPAFVEAKFAIHDCFFRATGLLYKSDYGGLRHFDLAGKLLLDVGANRGQSIIAFKNAVRSPKIVAFEANAPLAAALARRHALDDSVSVLNVALCDTEKDIVLHVPYYNGFMLDGVASLHIEEATGWANADRIYFFDRNRSATEAHRVPGRTLDSFKLEPALIKLHIQRSEIEALRGAEKTLKTSRPIIMSAWPWPDLINYLSDRGYRHFSYSNGRFVPAQRHHYMDWFLLNEHLEQVAYLLE